MDNSCWQGNVYGNVIEYFTLKPLKEVISSTCKRDSQMNVTISYEKLIIPDK